MHKTFLKIFTSLFILSLFVIPHSFVFAEGDVVKPIINTAIFAPNYQHYIDTYYQHADDKFGIIGSNFGYEAGKIINLENNNELITQNWSNSNIQIYTEENAGKLLLGDNRFILKTNEGVESDPFTINFKLYWIGPNILSISPATIHLGDQVEITGENFGDNPPSPCPVLSNDPNGVLCGLRDGGNRPQTVVSWSNTRIIARIDNTDIGTHRGIRVTVPALTSREREGKNGYIDILAPSCTSDTWSCGDWNTCSAYGSQTRTCNKTFDCPTATTPSPATSQGCVPPQPACNADTWTCGSWGECSLSGIQNRNCNKTFDCPNVQTAPPITDQYCEAPNRPTPQTIPSGTDEILNQDTIIKSTVKLLCPVNAQMASQGSGTVIDSSGIILTNKHVIAGTLGCLVGFINDFNDEPYFGERQIADIFKVSSNQDIAILKIRNPQNRVLTSIDIIKGNSNLRLGTKITIYGYPAKFGTNITYTSGDFSGTDGSYLKTTAILEYGNSGGGAFLKDGTFIGVPSAVVKGELNALGYILSINTINSWLGNTGIISGGTSNNNYSRVSVLEDIDLNKLASLKLFIPETDASGNLAAPVAPATNQKTQKAIEQSQPSQPQKESTIIESADTNKKIHLEQNNSISSEKGNNSSLKISEQRKSIVANAVQEMVKVAERNGGVGQEIKAVAQTQTQNQEKLETGIQKIQSRSGFAKFFIGPNYDEIKNSQKLLEQSKEQIQELDQLRTQIVNQGDQLQIVEQIQLLEQANQQIETSLNETQKGFSLFGWIFRLFTK